jgi:ADP-heptose:LPS heptosyltransferase
MHVALVGRSEDREVTSRVRDTAPGTLVDLTGKTSLKELAALLERAALLVSNDSGPAHLAAAVDCPTIAIFGPTDPALTFPYEDGSRFVSVARPIDHERPCFDARCASDHGFEGIAPREVLELALRVARRASPAGGAP